MRAPLFSIFKPEMLGNTLTTCLMMASAFVIYYANYALFATHLQLDIKRADGAVRNHLGQISRIPDDLWLSSLKSPPSTS